MRSSRRAIGMMLALVLTMGGQVFAAADTRAVLTLTINTVAKSEVTVTMRGTDVLLTRADLEDTGIQGLTFHGEKPADLVPLSQFKPFLTYTVDDKALTLDLTVAADHLGVVTFNYRPQSTLTIAKPARSVFMNYSVGFSSAAGADFTGELGTRIGAGLLETTRSFSGNGSYNSAVTRWTVDAPQSDERATIGDVDLSTGDLGSSVSMIGAEVHRYFGLSPNSVVNVLPGVRGSVGTPATADIYVNGTLVKTETLAPGQFFFQNLPTGLGPNNTQVVVTDAFGRRQSYNNYFFGADQLLAPGVSDFAYGVGVPHALYGVAPGRSQLGAGGRYAKGLNPNLTVGARIEASGSLLSGGGEALLRLHSGVLGIEGAASRLGDSKGAAGAITIVQDIDRFGVSASWAMQSPQYATLGQNASADRALSQASFVLSAPLRGSSIGLSLTSQRDRDQGAQQIWELTRWSKLSSTASIQVGATMTRTPSGKQFGVTATVNLIPRQGAMANLTASEIDGHRIVSAGIAKSDTANVPSFGYSAGVTSSDTNAASAYATGEFRGQYGTYFGTLLTGTGSGATSAMLQLAGGVVSIGGKIFATQPVNDSYALVSTGFPGVEVTVNGLDEGRTNRAGYVLVPQMGAYFNNAVALQPGDIPLNYAVDQSTRTIVPAYRSGEIVSFQVRRVLPVTGSLRIMMSGHPTIPAYGILEVKNDKGTSTSDIGEGGEFYFDKLEAGDYHAQIRFKGGACAFSIAVPATDRMFLKLGTLTCNNGVRS